MTALRAINCTQCGAGLSVLGGGRVLTHVCGYCGAVLDAQDGYKALASIGALDHPDSPLVIGAEIAYRGVRFTVIGTLGISETWAQGHAEWVEHQLFSPTHGYAWAAWEKGHLTFTRKLRDQPQPAWITPDEVEHAETPPRAVLKDERFRYFESGRSRIDFMEGEFNWRPAVGETTDYVTMMSDTAMLTYARSGAEREIERTELLDTEAILSEIGASDRAARAMHPLEPYRPLAHEGFMRAVCVGFAVLSLILALFLPRAGGETVLRQTVPLAALPQSFEVDLSDTARLVEVSLSSDVENAWAVFWAEVEGPDGLPVAAGERLTERYSGIEDGERWSEGSGRAQFRFRPQMAGPHVISFEFEESGVWRGALWHPSSLTVQVTQSVGSAVYLVGAALIFAAGAGLLTARRARHRRKRWSGGDWSEE